VFQLVLPLHECAGPGAAESAIVESAAEAFNYVADSAAAESAAEPLQFVADSAAGGAAPTEIS
jgi:hypothetical protein